MLIVFTGFFQGRSKQLGPVLKLVLGTGISVILVLWPLAGILGSILVGAGYGFLAPVFATFDAVGEGKTDDFIHCFVVCLCITFRINLDSLQVYSLLQFLQILRY